MYSFPDLEPVYSMSSSKCCFLTCIQISQEADQVVWYSRLGSIIMNKANRGDEIPVELFQILKDDAV